MADFGAERESLLANPELMAARKRLDDSIHDYGRDLKMSFNSLPGPTGPIPVPDAEDLVNIIGQHHSMLMNLRRDIIVTEVITKVLTLFIDEKVVEEVSRLCAESIIKHSEHIEKSTVKKREAEKTSSIITDVNPAISSKIKKANFGNN